MEQIHIIGPDTTLWIATNDAQTCFSEIELTKNHCIVPKHIYEDSLIDSSIEESIESSSTKDHVIYPIEKFHEIQDIRRRSYRACIWYPQMRIPTAKSKLIPLLSLEELRAQLNKYISKYPFVRLCTMSPKDICVIDGHSSITIDNVINVLQQSIRTRDMFSPPFCERCEGTETEEWESTKTGTGTGKHLFMRESRNYVWEARCFWSRDKLRAISLPFEFEECEKQSIIDFFDKWKHEIPYHSAVIDIGFTNEIEIIEFNTFGPDMMATAGNFSWREDVMILIFSPIPIFRH